MLILLVYGEELRHLNCRKIGQNCRCVNCVDIKQNGMLMELMFFMQISYLVLSVTLRKNNRCNSCSFGITLRKQYYLYCHQRNICKN